MGVGLYIHIPFCEKKCKYCDFYSVIGDMALKKAYIDRVIEEGRIRLDRVEVDTVFVGGGTPTSLSDGEMTRLIKGLNIDISSVSEFTVEGNPNSFTKRKIAEYKELGVTRVSVGVQCLNDNCLKTIGRLHDSKTAIKCVAELVHSGFRVSCDYMLGLPYQTVDMVRNDLELIIGLGAEHVSCYGLILEEGTELERMVRHGEICVASDDEAADMYDCAMAVLKEKNLSRYETSNFGKPCLHNLGYWKLKEYIGLGAAAHGFVSAERYKKWQGNTAFKSISPDFRNVFGDKTQYIRYANPSNINEYIRGENVSSLELSVNDVASEYIMLGLRLDEGIDLFEYKERFGESSYVQLLKKANTQKAYLDISANHIRIKGEYAYVANSIISELID